MYLNDPTDPGYMKYNTANEARSVAAKLGLDDVTDYEDPMTGEVIFMPGSTIDELNEALAKAGMTPASPPGDEGGLFGGMMY